MIMKRMMTLALAALVLCSMLSGCNPNGATTGQSQGDPTYKVTVIDPTGRPVTTGLVVKFMQEGVQKAMQTVDATGTAAKVLPKGEYTVELMFTVQGTDYGYDKANLKLTAEQPQLTIELIHKATEDGPVLSVKQDDLDQWGMNVTAEYPSKVVSTGRNEVELTANDKSYFLYMPEEGGYYEITVENFTGTVSYNGSPYAVQNLNLAQKVEGKENTIRLEVQNGSAGAEHVLSIENTGAATSCILRITRVGDVEELVWINYANVSERKPYTLPVGAAIRDFDLMQEYDIVFNEADGYYHVGTKDGPLVLVRLGANSDKDCKYLLQSWETVASTDYVVAYHYDAAGEVTERINYGPAILEYFELDDEKTGLYPLNQDLYTILRDVGTSKGWWDKSRPELGVIKDPNSDRDYDYLEESGWLFNLCYLEV